MFPHTPRATPTTTPFPPEPQTPQTPQTPQPDPAPAPDRPETPGYPEETPFTEPKQYPIHPEIHVQPIHENDPTRCERVTGGRRVRAHARAATSPRPC